MLTLSRSSSRWALRSTSANLPMAFSSASFTPTAQSSASEGELCPRVARSTSLYTSLWSILEPPIAAKRHGPSLLMRRFSEHS